MGAERRARERDHPWFFPGRAELSATVQQGRNADAAGAVDSWSHANESVGRVAGIGRRGRVPGKREGEQLHHGCRYPRRRRIPLSNHLMRSFDLKIAAGMSVTVATASP